MKKNLLFVLGCAMLAVIGTANAQETTFGAKAGLNLANITGDDVEDADMRLGFAVGGYADIMFSDNFGFSPELLFSLQGSSSEQTTEVFDDLGNVVGSEKQDFTLNLTYINIPLLAKWKPTDGLNLHVGPQIGLLLGATNKVDPEPDGFDDDASDFYKSLDIGLAVGAGYELESGLNFGVRYATSLGSIAEPIETIDTQTGAKTEEDQDIKNSVIMVSVGYTFGK